MAMMIGSGSKRTQAEINVTPLIDVLLVLLIIFMVIVPVAPKGFGAVLPKPAGEAEQQPVVLEVSAGGNGVSYRINGRIIAKNDLLSTLSQIYAARSDRAMFVKGDPALDFSQIAEVIDIGHAAGVDQIGMTTPGMYPGSTAR